jgi:hypothetical protein
MSGETPYSFTTKLNGDLFTVRGTNPDEFLNNIKDALDVIESLKVLQTAAQANMASAVEAVKQVIPTATPTAQVNGDEIAVVPDKYGNIWTYNRPDAPPHPVRGHFVLKAGTNQAGKAYKGWFDPCQGPLWPGGPISKEEISAPIWEKTR